MIAADFITQVRPDLQEKSEHWSNEELLIKLQRSYIGIQSDLPFFITKETLAIESGKSEYYLEYVPLKNVSFKMGESRKLDYVDSENFYISDKQNIYTFDHDKVLLKSTTMDSISGDIVYKYAKELTNMNCHIEIPIAHYEALRLLFMSKIHEKPTRNTKERNLSTHYLNLYSAEIQKIKIGQRMRPKNNQTTYQGV